MQNLPNELRARHHLCYIVVESLRCLVAASPGGQVAQTLGSKA